MLQTEEQRRWWFATHPEFSSSRKGTRTGTHENGGKESSKVSPEAVDAYVDRMLPYEDGPVPDLLRSVKKNFGTEAADNDNGTKHSDHGIEEQSSRHKKKWPQFRKYSNEELRSMGIPTPEEEALISDPHTFLDVAPYARFITAPVQGLRSLLTNTARNTVLYWKKGDDIFDRTTSGRVPAWNTIAQRYWKNESLKEGAIGKWGPENIRRMKAGRAPQQINRKTGDLESKELHHHPTPRRRGGREFIEVWPEEHAAIDPQRRLKK